MFPQDARHRGLTLRLARWISGACAGGRNAPGCRTVPAPARCVGDVEDVDLAGGAPQPDRRHGRVARRVVQHLPAPAGDAGERPCRVLLRADRRRTARLHEPHRATAAHTAGARRSWPS